MTRNTSRMARLGTQRVNILAPSLHRQLTSGTEIRHCDIGDTESVTCLDYCDCFPAIY